MSLKPVCDPFFENPFASLPPIVPKAPDLYGTLETEYNEVLDYTENQLLEGIDHDLDKVGRQEYASSLRRGKIKIQDMVRGMIARKAPIEEIEEAFVSSAAELQRSALGFRDDLLRNRRLREEIDSALESLEHRAEQGDYIPVAYQPFAKPTRKEPQRDPVWTYNYDALHRNMVSAKLGAAALEIATLPLTLACKAVGEETCKSLVDMGKSVAKTAVQAVGMEKTAKTILKRSSGHALAQTVQQQFLVPKQEALQYEKDAGKRLTPLLLIPAAGSSLSGAGKIIDKVHQAAKRSTPVATKIPKNTVLSSDNVTIHPSPEYFKNRIITQRTPLVPEDIGFNSQPFHYEGKKNLLSGWMQKESDNVLKVRIDYILTKQAHLDNFLSVIDKLKQIAKANNAQILKINGEVLNKKLLTTMTKRYGEPAVRPLKNSTFESHTFEIPVD